ncbi:MAG: hypothetical protein AAFO94_21180, partial [Bacteroidota bacterium]
MKKLFWLILMTLAFALQARAQTLRAYERAAEKAFEQKDYYAALVYYEVVLEATEQRVDIFYDYAEAARLFNALPLAENYYQKVIMADSVGQYPETAFHLAGIKQKLGKYQ